MIQRETVVNSRRTKMKGCNNVTVPAARHRFLSGGDPLTRVLTVTVSTLMCTTFLLSKRLRPEQSPNGFHLNNTHKELL